MSAAASDVVWAEAAIRDLERIVDFLAARDPALASRELDRIESKVEGLRRFPGRGRVVPELRAQEITTYRELLVAPYRVLYRAAEARVVVVAVIDGRRDLESALLQRLVDD